MTQSRTNYPIKMAVLVIGHTVSLTLFVWLFSGF